MQVTKISTMSGKSNTMELNVTQEQLDRYAQGGILIQQCFPNLTPPEREFIKSGITPTEWKQMFG